MRVGIYARVSSEDQRDRGTVASQLSTLPAFAAARGWTIVGTFTDDGKSADTGKLEARKGLAALHAAATRGELDIVLVVDLDRLTRSADWIERGQVYGPLQRAGVKIAVSSTGALIDFADDMGDLMLGLGNMQSAGWLKKHKERILRGKLEAISQGRKPAGPTPFGYLYDRATRAWSVDPELGPIVLEIFERLSGGEGTWVIAKDLDARGVLTCQPSQTKRRRIARWAKEKVWVIATRRCYLGEWTADKRRGLKMKIPALVTPAIFAAAQAQLDRFKLRGRARARHVYLCDANLATCAYCGAPMRVSAACLPNRGRMRAAYYICAHRRKAAPSKAPCSLPMRRVDEVDGRVWAAVERLLADPAALRDALAERKRRARADRETWRGDLKAAEKAIARLDRIEDALLDKFRRGLVTERAWERELLRVAHERAQQERQAAAARHAGEGAAKEQTAAENAVEAAGKLWREVSMSSSAERRDLIRQLVPLGGVELGKTEVTVTLLLDEGAPVAVAPESAAVTSSRSGSNPRRLRVVA